MLNRGDLMTLNRLIGDYQI